MEMCHYFPCSITHGLILLLSLLLLLFSSSPPAEASRALKEAAAVTSVEATMVGSRPPRCEGVCSACGHCEAVQVPLLPSTEKEQQHRADGASNYKPMDWKCKCGDTILNP